MKRLLIILLVLPLSILAQTSQSGGTLTFDRDIVYGDTYWDDTRLIVNGGLSPANAPDLVEVNSTGTYGWGFAGAVQNESVALEGQLSHRVTDSTNIEVHVHVTPTTAPSPGDTAVLEIVVVWSRIGGIFGNEVDTTFTVDIGLDAISQWEHHYFDVGEIEAIGQHKSSIITATVTRLQNDASDNYGNDLIIWTLDFHTEIVSPGSDNEHPY